MNLPNKLVIFRVILIPLCIVFLMVPAFNGFGNYIAVGIFILACLTDFADGKISRHFHLVTNFGKFADPLADKILVCSVMIALVSMGEMYAWAVMIIVAREFIISGFRLIASDNGIVIAADFWGKWKTTFQMIAVIVLMLQLPGKAFFILGIVLTDIAVVLTVISLVDYMVKNRQVLKEQQ